MARTKTSRTTAPDEQTPPVRHRMLRTCVGLALAGLLALGWVACLSHHLADPPNTQIAPRPETVHNWAGSAGAAFSYYVFEWLGKGVYMALLFGSVAAGMMIAGQRLKDLGLRIVGTALLVAATSAAVFLVSPYAPGNHLVGGGGVLGAACGFFLQAHFGAFSWCIVLVSLLVGLVLTADELVLRMPHLTGRLLARRRHLLQMAAALAAPKSADAPDAPAARSQPKARREPKAAPEPQPAPAPEPKTRVSIMQKPQPQEEEDEPAEPPAAPAAALTEKLKSLVNAATAKAESRPKAPPKALPKPPARPAAPPAARREAADGYPLPGMDLLIDAEEGYIASQQVQVELKRSVLQQTLEDFNVDARVVGHMTGPVITMFELSLAPGVKVSQIASLAGDIARALAAPSVRIVSPIPGKDTIGIEVPNAEKETVRLKQLMQLDTAAADRYKLPLYLGKDAGGDPIVADLSRMPHMLIAGTTGSGKSVCINTIILSMLMTRRPDDVRLILVDPKMVEMAAFERIPHLLCPIVNDMRKAESILEWAAMKMDERYELLKDAGVKNIAGYNALGADKVCKRLGAETDEEKSAVQTKMPYYVIIVDELADLIMTSAKEVEDYIIRIAQKARAVGIHLILATQRPSANVVTGLIKSNMPCRISFRVASRQESRIVLDQNGAEVLLGQGDMLFLQPGTSNLVRAQGTYMDDCEIQGAVDYLATIGEPQFSPELVSIKPAGVDGEGDGERDDLFDKAVEIILQVQRGSVSLLQRRLAIGYTRASRIVDQMAEAGILGEFKGSQAREVMMTLEDWHALKAGIDADQSGSNALDGEPMSV
ncbi:MAG: DNA translocase FtsK [Planctomycetes bacterium]|nr:DNA translocase FtsK [Planctomycetota bacterium]